MLDAIPNTPDHGSRGHAEFSPSSLKYVAACPAYEGKGGSSFAADMGTRIHEALEIRDPSALHNEEEQAIYDQIVEMEDQFLSNFPIDPQQDLNEIQVEIKLNGTETWGTCDRFSILEGGRAAVMADYKTGISIIDPPEKNWQAKAYVAGAFQKFPDIEEITFVFYIPQHHATPAHTFLRSGLDEMLAELSAVVLAGEQIRPKWKTGTPELDECSPSQNCRFCLHEDHCPALGGLVVKVAQAIRPELPPIDYTNMSDPANLAELFNIAKIVENWADSVKKAAMEAAKSGVELEGLKLRSMGRTRKFSDNVELAKLAEQFGVKLEDLLLDANLSVSKVTQLIANQYSKVEGKEKLEIFLEACEVAGILQISDERFTLASR
jgi:hypothetical protein